MTREEEIDQFKTSYRVLCQQYRMVVTSCGCCPPSATDIELEISRDTKRAIQNQTPLPLSVHDYIDEVIENTF